jgi:hypothetical protein
MSRARRIYEPEAAAVKTDRRTPIALGGVAVEAIREDWLLEDRWWAEWPLHRHYYELVLVDGRATTVFLDLRTGRWQRQSA